MDAESNIIELNLSNESILPLLPGMHFPDLFDWHPSGMMPELSIFQEVSSFNGLLSSLLITPVEYLRRQLRLFRYIGPLRKVPERGYTPALAITPERWADGLAAWDKLHKPDTSFLNKMNDWLLNRLQTGYSVEVKQYKEVDIASPFALAFSQGRFMDEELDLQDQFISLPTKRRLLIREAMGNIEVAPADIGVGISQILPVLALALAFQQGVLAIEQPELHIHPALQVALGDLFIEEINSDNNINGGKIFLLETHSEHLMLRFLRRIRETNEQGPSGKKALKPSELSIYFVEQGENGISCLPMRVDEDGEFVDRWPKGFFEERERELL